MIPVLIRMLRSAKRLLPLMIVLFGTWLLYWDCSDFATQGLNTGVWDVSILQAGLPSIVVGAIIIFVGGYIWHVRGI